MSLITRIVEILSVKPKPAEVPARAMYVGEFFLWNKDIYVALEEKGHYNPEAGVTETIIFARSFSTGDVVTFQNELVHRINLVKVEWEYVR